MLAVLAGCAEVSGDVVAGNAPDSYRLSERVTPLQGGAATAAQIALARASRFCGAHDRVLVPLRSQETGWPVQQRITGPTGFVLDFRCAAPEKIQLNVGRPG